MHFKKSCGCRKAPRAYSCNSRCYINSHFAPEYGRLICDTTNPFDKELLSTSTITPELLLYVLTLLQTFNKRRGRPQRSTQEWTPVLSVTSAKSEKIKIKIHHRHTSQMSLKLFLPAYM